MSIGVDAQAFGMANAVVASTNSVSAAYWNPAGLLALEDNQAILMHANYFANIAQYDYAGFAMPIDDDSVMALSLIRFGVDDILDTTELIDSNGNIDFNRIELFSAADYGLTFSYARNLKFEGVWFGANAKIIRRVIGDFASSWGFGIDVGLQYKSFDKTFELGLMARDVTTTFNAWAIDEEEFARIQAAVPGQNQELPESTELTLPKLQLGIAKTFDLRSNLILKSEVDLNMRFTQTNDLISSSFVSISPAGGVDLGYNDLAFLRVGVGNFQNVTQLDGSENISIQPNFGVGFKYKGISVDYALTDIGNATNVLYSNIFSVKVDWSLFRP
ncbi:MAG: PorV/PorQ family protein [Flavobacteriaceae bacterium]|nr:PorV/PorQ family protein [Flavobacteriaceae bacterium]